MKTIRNIVGLSPGSLIFTGKQHADQVRIDIIDSEPGQFSELNTENIEHCFPYKDSPTNTNTNQRPKIEVFDHYIFIVLRMLSYNEEKNIVDSEQASFKIGHSYVISLQEKKIIFLNPCVKD